MRKKALVLSLLAAFGLQSFAQQDRDRAFAIARRAVSVMDQGKLGEAKSMLKRALELDPENIHILYELAYAHYLSREYQDCVEILRETIRDRSARDYHYAILGNALDMMNERSEAEKIYQKGRKRFPESGRILVELGIMALNQGDIDLAISYWEEGMEVNPTYPANYYWAAKAMEQIGQPAWGILYGESFILLESGSTRAKEMADWLYKLYLLPASAFCELGEPVQARDLKKPDEKRRAFSCIMGQEFLKRDIPDKSDRQLDDILFRRASFLDHWASGQFHRSFSHPLLNHLLEIRAEGHLEAYVFWLFRNIKPQTFDNWRQSERGQQAEEGFAQWIRTHPFQPLPKAEMTSR